MEDNRAVLHDVVKMDWLTFIERSIGHLAWPVVAVLVLLFFRRKLGEILGRIVEILLPGGAGLKLASPIQQDVPLPGRETRGLEQAGTLPYYLRAAPDIEPYVREEEERIEADLATIPLEQRERTLIRSLVTSKLSHFYEMVYNTIFGGQLKVLQRALQAGESGLDLSDIRGNYEEILRAGKWNEKDYPESLFIGFLLGQKLLERGHDERYRLTPIGRGFLQYLSSTGRPLTKVP
jgi:hypothetical protein